MKKKLYTGLTQKTKEHLLLDAGAFFKNFTVGTDNYETAVAAGKLIGATNGGGEFTAVATYRSITVDGAIGDIKGMTDIDRWDIALKVNVIEVTEDTLVAGLGAAVVDKESDENYSILTGRGYVDDTDYISNVTWVGCLSGNDKPVVIQVYNALSKDGLTVTMADKGNSVLALKFVGHYEPSDTGASTEPPFKIFYPKTMTQEG